ncbi:methionyl-tRNA formyltransferase [Lactobacillus helveticus]|uniref:methionyl-tRNA formyltransferase n=1 Tax=Lactobacillus TaxID=1578 RepID=UPI001562D140|nr:MULTISPECIES: methionyl-tRNA formyltransferase [Lactobacillus]MCP9316344.1 methionyl-tRNA formyltransferase [Lactobacillus helveticus]MCT0164340.1 methionyl-tRNA formyltransferase [Lactobacillus helveticus]MCT0191855.1 methionyl-tRNA formyltransferase [Lactobacillus helveticus]MCT0196806.1 methionyl-tRNA formyltransferase [Lactobacillus helveticus]MDH5816872.1 methionyl-tRNA formyltransferase [Lactobacillus helveticus]
MTSVIFMGTPEFSVPVLEGLIKNNYEIKAVVTQPDKKVGRKQKITKTPAKIAAEKHDLPVFQPVKLSGSEEMQQVIDMHADLIVTAAYGQFLPTKFLNSVKIAGVNVHGSLLPKYRGGAPIQYSLINGDAETGITIMEMVKKMDAGDIYSQKAIKIEPDDNAGTLFSKLSIVGRDLLLETLPSIIDGSVKKIPQDPDKVVFSPNITKEQERIVPTMTATEANNMIRALNPDPGAYMMLEGKRFKVWKAEVAKDSTDLKSGCVVANKGRFAISFADGTVLNLLEVQPSGKMKMDIKNFLNGQGSKFAPGEEIVDK